MKIMKRLLIFSFGLLFTIFSCKKDGDANVGSECAMKLKSHFKDELRCSKKGEMESNLYAGEYKGKTVYFVDTMCPLCNTVPPAFGFTCNLEKIIFEDFAELKNREEVYNSCTKKFIN